MSVDIKALAARLGRPIKTLLALSSSNDPFYAGVQPSKLAAAEWFAKLYRERGFGRGVHLRKLHYRIVSDPVPLPNGEPYLNSEECWDFLCEGSKHARYLGLVDVGAFVDHRAPEPHIYLPDMAEEPSLWCSLVYPLAVEIAGVLPDRPYGFLSAPLPRTHHVEIWCEKSTVDDVLRPIGNRLGCNIVTGVGEMSISACRDLIARVRANGGRSARVGYLSDFDPAGASMPLAVARKIEFFLRQIAEEEGVELDVQLHPLALTYEQCVQFKLPRTPLKESERRAARFEERFGAGATELDALEALHPGALRKIVEGFAERYRNRDFERRWRATERAIQERLDEITDAVRKEHAEELATLQERLDALREEFMGEAEELSDDVERVYRAMRREIEKRLQDVEFDMPEPEPVDELPDPLFDSRRDYVTQIDRYLKHQGREAKRKTASRSRKKAAE